MQKDKNKKKTLTISSSFTKKLDPSSYGRTAKKSYVVDNKRSSKPQFKTNKNWNNTLSRKSGPTSRNLNRKFAEQQATKRFIGSDQKRADKDKTKEKASTKNKGFQTRRQSKLTISRAMNVEEFEIKQRSLASVKRARLKEKQDENIDKNII